MAGSEAPTLAPVITREPLSIRPLATLDEFAEAVRLQKVIWGFADVDLLPQRLFVVASKIGGQTYGAFDGGRMVAFAIAIPGLKPGGQPYLHSHMVGVLPEYRDRGLGRQLKLRQREDALANGVALMEWTFDPLELKNARFNIERLGAVVRRYVLNQYGITSSHLHGALPTDRCVAEWHLAAERVADAVSGHPPRRPVVEQRVPVPADIAQLRRDHPTRARAIQAELSERLIRHFRDNLAVVGFELSPGFGTYLLGRLT